MGLKGYTQISNDIDVNYCDNKIVNFINVARQYCNTHAARGQIYFVSDQNYMFFVNDLGHSEQFHLPEGFKLNPISLSSGYITIDQRGFTPSACTINFTDRKDKAHSITMCVGSGNVEIKY